VAKESTFGILYAILYNTFLLVEWLCFCVLKLLCGARRLSVDEIDEPNQFESMPLPPPQPEPNTIVPLNDAQPSTPTMQVQMPSDGLPGQEITVQGPNGPFTITLPSGILPGTVFSVPMPLPSSPQEPTEPQAEDSHLLLLILCVIKLALLLLAYGLAFVYACCYGCYLCCLICIGKFDDETESNAIVTVNDTQPSVQVLMPSDSVPGQQMTVQGPNGPFTLTLPSGIPPGTVFSAAVPLPPPQEEDTTVSGQQPPPSDSQTLEI